MKVKLLLLFIGIAILIASPKLWGGRDELIDSWPLSLGGKGQLWVAEEWAVRSPFVDGEFDKQLRIKRVGRVFLGGRPEIARFTLFVGVSVPRGSKVSRVVDDIVAGQLKISVGQVEKFVPLDLVFGVPR
jgi:hypothetical protein